MALSKRAQVKFLAWLTWCRNHGWSKKDMPVLAELWLKYYDEETGELVK
jgi:hypothetical protein